LNWGPGGGITVGGTTDFYSAASIVRNGGNIFSPIPGDAYWVADYYSIGSSPVWHSGHDLNDMPNNRPHWHCTYLWVQVGGHSFE